MIDGCWVGIRDSARAKARGSVRCSTFSRTMAAVLFAASLVLPVELRAQSSSIYLGAIEKRRQATEQAKGTNQAASAARSDLTAAINTAGIGIMIVPGNDVAITTLENGVLASDLGIVTDMPTGAAIEGLDLDRRVMNNTPISDLFAGAGIDFAGAIARFQQTQTALQASLLASGQTLNLSLLNFLS